MAMEMTDEGFLQVNGEPIPKDKAMELIRMLCNDAKQMAGMFHGQNRSAKFRVNWPNEYVFADSEWRNFVEATRALYAEQMGDPLRSEYDKHRMFLAICLWDQVAKEAPEQYAGNQIMPNTQQFAGDPFENKKIVETWGKHSDSFKDLLMGSTRYH